MPTVQPPSTAKVTERLAGYVSSKILEHRKELCNKCPLQSTCDASQKIERAETACPAYLFPRFNALLYVDLPTNTTNHLIYHIWPVVGSVWRENIEELGKRWSVFNGIKRFGIVTDSTTENVDSVRSYIRNLLQDDTIEFCIARNNSALREVVTFISLLKPIAEKYKGETDLTFSAHAKGIKYSEDLKQRWQDSAVWKWVLWMYRICLDDMASVHRHLSAFPFAGGFKRYGQFTYPKNFKWHYSGTFWWFRNKDIFSNEPKKKNSGWQRVIQQWFGTEAYPANHFDIHETSCLFGDNVGNLYLDSEWERLQSEITLYETARQPFNSLQA